MDELKELLESFDKIGTGQTSGKVVLTQDEIKLQDDSALSKLQDATNMVYSDEQADILRHRGGMNIIACAGSGKALQNGTGVLTPNGYVPIEKLRVGDICYDVNGKEQKVLGVYPQGIMEIHLVKFSDGSEIGCCKDHLWDYQTYEMRMGNRKWKTDTTENIMNNVSIKMNPHINENGETQNRPNIYIPMSKAVQFSKKDLPIKPYLLGVILANGLVKSEETGKYTSNSNDTNIVNRVNKELEEAGELLEDKLRDLGILEIKNKDKYIPVIYKLTNVEDRLAILQGIVDVNGNLLSTSYELTLASEELIDNIKFIVESLGMVAVKSTRIDVSIKPICEEKSKVYRIYIKTSNEIPKIHWTPTKDSQWNEGQATAKRSIASIKRTDKYVEMTCIQVSGDSKLYLTENCIVTHNTTVLTQMITKRIMTGEIKDPSKLMCTTYSKAGADEMNQRLHELFKQVGIASTVQVKTLHALYLNILKRVNYPTDVIDNGTRIRYILEACKDAKYRLGDEDLPQIDTLLSYQVNNLLSDSALVKSYVFTLENMTEQQYTAIRVGYNKRKMENRQIDFDDMQLYVYSLLIGSTAAQIIEYCKYNWTDYYIDEAQDVSRIQFEILRKIVPDSESLIFIGDDDQCVYKWRGADPSIILNIGAYYDIKRFMLSTNYRCAANILKDASKGIENNSRRYPKNMRHIHEGGRIRVLDTGKGNLNNTTKYAYKHIKNLIENEGAKLGEIAVLSRNNQHLAILNNLLYRNGIYSNITNDMKLTRTAMFRDIKNVMDMAMSGFNHHITASTLWRLVTFLGVANSNFISRIQNNANLSLTDTIGYMFKTSVTGGDKFWDKELNIPRKIDLQIQDLWRRMKMETKESLAELLEILLEEDQTLKVKSLLSLYLINAGFMYKTMDRSRTINGLVEYVFELIDEVGLNEAVGILRITEQYESSNMVIPGDKITMSTMHGAKGREWKHVILFADDNVTFPSFDGIKTMLGRGVSTSDVIESIEENRRLHYVAMTRAKEDLTIIAELDNLSVYTAESLGLVDKETANNRILQMAENGELERDLKKQIRNKVNSPDHNYKYELGEEKDEQQEESTGQGEVNNEQEE